MRKKESGARCVSVETQRALSPWQTALIYNETITLTALPITSAAASKLQVCWAYGGISTKVAIKRSNA
ncbi:hypothetical protein [Rhodoblastus sphagnicola]|uniref:hypothetical protein n=1 Tax=Rhodoblastus sphagnicola TaxID=333368 RepID=UPI001304855A|nr:hypothetical protein [Rhodoblastus sphagnicola]